MNEGIEKAYKVFKFFSETAYGNLEGIHKTLNDHD